SLTLFSLCLPWSTHRLSILSEFGILHPKIIWTKCAMSFIHRTTHSLPLFHPTHASILPGIWNDSTAAINHRKRNIQWYNNVSSSVLRWCIDNKKHSITQVCNIAHFNLWRRASKCRDLLNLRPTSDTSRASYISLDSPLHACLRARLRLNR